MNYSKPLLAMFAFGLCFSASETAFADLKVCNRRSSPMWVTHAMFRPNQTRLRHACATQQATGSCFFSAWESAGWYRANPGSCVTTWIGAIPNRFIGVRAEFDDGALLQGPHFFQVDAVNAFTWDQFETLHGSNCVVGSGVFDPCSAQISTRGFFNLDVGSNTNFTFNIF
jgi:uncharacterized membrane protein